MKNRLGCRVLTTLGVDRMFRSCNKDKTVVLMYHGVVEDDETLAVGNSLQVTQTAFRQQMLHLSKCYDVIPLRDIEQPHKGKKPRAVVTFDDGYANNYKVAYPILKELGLPATIYLVTGYINTNHIFWYDRVWCAYTGHTPINEIQQKIDSFKSIHPHNVDQAVIDYLTIATDRIGSHNNDNLIHNTYGILTYEQIEEMKNSGLIEFGSHTHRHEILTKMSDIDIVATLSESLHYGRKHLGIEFTSFCSPNGNYDPHHLKIFEALKFNQATTTEPGFNTSTTNQYEIPRMFIGRNQSIQEFSLIVSGVLYVISILRNTIKGMNL